MVSPSASKSASVNPSVAYQDPSSFCINIPSARTLAIASVFCLFTYSCALASPIIAPAAAPPKAAVIGSPVEAKSPPIA
jgi:hypothetical protein